MYGHLLYKVVYSSFMWVNGCLCTQPGPSSCRDITTDKEYIVQRRIECVCDESKIGSCVTSHIKSTAKLLSRRNQKRYCNKSMGNRHFTLWRRFGEIFGIYALPKHKRLHRLKRNTPISLYFWYELFGIKRVMVSKHHDSYMRMVKCGKQIVHLCLTYVIWCGYIGFYCAICLGTLFIHLSHKGLFKLCFMASYVELRAAPFPCCHNGILSVKICKTL